MSHRAVHQTTTNDGTSRRSVLVRLIAVAIVCGAAVLTGLVESTSSSAATAPTITQFDLLGPPGSSEYFGRVVLVLSNGNYLVTDIGYDVGTSTDAGAVFL